MLNKPTHDYVTRRLPDFDAVPRISDADRAVTLVFRQWPENKRIDEVLVKVSTLNALYSTNIYALNDVARHILELNIDSRLVAGDPNVVDEIAKVTIGGGRRYLLSFASKYCSWHHPVCYQIYDSLVDDVLWTYQRQFAFTKFKRQELRSYPRFVQVVDVLVDHCGLQAFSRKELDKFLWLEGRALAKLSSKVIQ